MLRGCLEKGRFGHIMIKPFSLSIKALDSPYDFKQDFKLTQWQKLIGFMQKQAAIDPYSPK